MAEILFIFIIAIIAFVSILFNKRINPKYGKIIIIFSIIIIALCCAFIQPKSDYDLAGHYITIGKIKYSNIGFWEFIFNAARVTNSNYSFMYSFNILSYIVSNYLPLKALPFISICVCYGIFGYILHDIYKENKNYRNYHVVISILVMNLCMPILYIYSNLRNEISAAIMGLVVYFWIYKKRNYVLLIVLAAISVTMHPLSAIAIPFILISKIKPGKKGVILVAIIPILTEFIMNKFSYSKIDIIRYIGIKYYNYTFVKAYSQGGFFFYCACVALIVIIVLTVFVDKDALEKKDQILLNFIAWYCIFSLANIRSYQIILRMPFIVGTLTPCLAKTLFSIQNYRKWKMPMAAVLFSVILVFSLGAIINNYMWMG